MKKKLSCILLIDDDDDCNFFHQRLLKKMDCSESIEIAANGIIGLDFLRSKKNKPAIVFLDINMPKMDGWEFLTEYEKLDESEKATIVLIMLTSSLNPEDQIKAEAINSVRGFNTKYLDEEQVKKTLVKHFSDYF